MLFSITFTDTGGWSANVEVEAEDSFAAVSNAVDIIRDSARGEKLDNISKIEVDEA